MCFFVTAFEHNVVQALRANAINCIEKPIDPDELMAAIRKTEDRMKTEAKPTQSDLLLTIGNQAREKIAVPTKSGIAYLYSSESLCIQIRWSLCIAALSESAKAHHDL